VVRWIGDPADVGLRLIDREAKWGREGRGLGDRNTQALCDELRERGTIVAINVQGLGCKGWLT
jgi:hypothetical protein